MRKIVLVVPSFGLGGLETQIVNLINHLSSDLYFYIISITDNLKSAEKIQNKNKVSIITLKKQPSKYHLSCISIYSILLKIKPDIVVASNWGSIEALLSAWICRVKKVIYVEHGFSTEEASKRKWRRIWGRRLLLKLATNIVIVSAGLKELAEVEWWVQPKKISQIINGVDIKKFSPICGDEDKASFGFIGENFIIGTVASLTSVKNQKLLIDILWRSHPVHPELRLVIVGEGPEKSSLIQYAREKNIFDKIILYGAAEDPSALYRSFDIFALTSLSEQMPISVLEAMASGLPVLATDVGDIKDMVSIPNRRYVYPLERSEEMSNGLREFINDQDLVSSIGKANRLKVELNYSIDRSIAAYRALFES